MIEESSSGRYNADMPFTIFYAWQMDRPTNLCRWLIHTALKAAIKQLQAEFTQKNAELKLEDSPAVEDGEENQPDPEPSPDDTEIELQSGAEGHVGAGMIAETILKRIETCGVFVADLTFVSEVKTADGRTKLMPNANVLIETGAAAKSGDGWDRMIFVLNNAYGDVEKLPFDLKHRSVKVQYDLADNADPLKSDKRKQLTTDFVKQLRPMYQNALDVAAVEQRRIEAIQAAAQKERLEPIRRKFEDDLRGDRFHTFKAEAGILALSILPINVLAEKIAFDANQKTVAREWFTPFGLARTPDIQPLPEGVMLPSHSDRIPRTLTEVREDGYVFSATNLIYGRDNIMHFPGYDKADVQQPWSIGMNIYQSDISTYLRKYLCGMVKLGVAGPWSVGISLLRVKNCLLRPTYDANFRNAGGMGQPYAGEDVVLEPLIVAIDPAAMTDDQMTTLLEPRLRKMWRHFRFDAYPRFTSREEWTWVY